jgi:hypothetical protein
VVVPGQVGLDQLTVLAGGDGVEAGRRPALEGGQVLVPRRQDAVRHQQLAQVLPPEPGRHGVDAVVGEGDLAADEATEPFPHRGLADPAPAVVGPGHGAQPLVQAEEAGVDAAVAVVEDLGADAAQTAAGTHQPLRFHVGGRAAQRARPGRRRSR